MLLVLVLALAAVGVLLILLARLLRGYPLAFLGLVAVVVAGALEIVVDQRLYLGFHFIVLSLFSVIFAGLWLYKNKKWGFWWSFGADLGIVTAAVLCTSDETRVDLDTFDIANESELLALIIPLAVMVAIGILGSLIVNWLIPVIRRKNKNERKHRTNTDTLIGKCVPVVKDKEDGRSQRALIGDVDWAIEPFMPGETFKVGDVVKIHQIKGVTLLVTRSGKDYRKEMRDKRKAEAEEARKKREEAKAKKAAEQAKKAEEKKEEPAPVVEEPKPVEEPAPVVEEPAPIVEEPAPIVEEPAPVVEEPAPIVEEPKPVKVKAEFVPFNVRLVQADDFVREAYNELKSEILSYGIKSRVSTTGDTFRLHKKEYCKMVVAGKYLKLYLALNPDDYKDTTYPYEDASRMGAHEKTPFVFKIKSGLSIRRAKVLIADAAKKDELVQGEVVKHNHFEDVKDFKY